MDRREFLTGTMGAALLASLPADALAQPPAPPATSWDAGQVRHLLPTIGDTALLIKASFKTPQTAPRLRVGTSAAAAHMSDTAGECWQFYANGLQPGRRHRLSLTASNGRALCEPWEISTFPPADARPDRVRLLFFTCAGGPESTSLTAGNLPTAVRNRLLRRALSFAPDAAIANGDHVYWDLHSVAGAALGTSAQRLKAFDQSALVFGSTNETALKTVAAPQIVPVYGTDFRSTPVFFMQDDHDYFDNDEGTDAIVTFPPPWFQLQLARATQRMYYPEFLPHATRPLNLPWSSSSDRPRGVSESFGTLRYGRLAEVDLFDVRRTMTLAGPSAVFIDVQVERWLAARAASDDVTHVIQAPSNPLGWSAGKWAEWYPDLLAENRGLTTAKPKPYWQSGWLAQHDRLVSSLTAMKNRIPLTISGDLHAIGMGRMQRAGRVDASANPVTTVLAGPIGTAPAGWPSARRGVGATPPAHLDLREMVKPIEQHGFTIVDVMPERIELRQFRWDVKTQRPEAIDHLEPFHTEVLTRTA